MPAPRFGAKINRRVTNLIARRFAGRIPPFAIIEHRGRRSGTRYRTPIMAFRTGDGFLIALTYGAETDWVRNVLAERGASIEYRKQLNSLREPKLIKGDAASMPLPAFVRLILRLLNVTESLRLIRDNAESPPVDRTIEHRPPAG